MVVSQQTESAVSSHTSFENSEEEGHSTNIDQLSEPIVFDGPHQLLDKVGIWQHKQLATKIANMRCFKVPRTAQILNVITSIPINHFKLMGDKDIRELEEWSITMKSIKDHTVDVKGIFELDERSDLIDSELECK